MIAAQDGHIACTVGGSVQMKPDCAVERIGAAGKPTLVVSRPDSAPSDGAEKGATSLADGKLDVTLGGDQYLFPSTETPDGAH